MFNFPAHQILMETSLKMDGNKKIDCRAVDYDWFKASVWKKSLRGQTQLTFAKSKSVHRHCAIRHGGGLGCNLGGSKKPSSTLKATSTEMPCRKKIQMTGVQLQAAAQPRILMETVQGHYHSLSWVSWLQKSLSGWLCYAPSTFLRHMETMCAPDNEGSETRS